MFPYKCAFGFLIAHLVFVRAHIKTPPTDITYGKSSRMDIGFSAKSADWSRKPAKVIPVTNSEPKNILSVLVCQKFELRRPECVVIKLRLA